MNRQLISRLPFTLYRHPLIIQLQNYVKETSIQDVNDCVINNNGCVENFLKEINVKQTLHHIGLMNLRESIECHNDCSFIGTNIRSKVLCIVLDYKFKKKYPDSPSYPQFYTKKDGFMDICKWDMFWFNAKQDHALLNNGRLKLDTFWFDR